MAIGIIYFTQSATAGLYIEGKIEWVSTADVALNQSKVSANIYVRTASTTETLTIATTGTWTYDINVNGYGYRSTRSVSVLEDWVFLGSYSTVVDYGTNVSKSITISGAVTAPDGTDLGGHKTQGRDTAKLDDIQRVTSLDLLTCATSYFTGEMTYKYTPKSDKLYNQCNIALNLDGEYAVKTINLGQKHPSQQTATVTLTESELSAIYNLLPSSTSGNLRFTLRTYSDSGYSTQVGDPLYKEISLTIPNDTTTQPTATLTVDPESTLASPFNALYIKGKTKAKATLDSGEGKYGATPKSYKVTIGSQSGASPLTSAYLTTPGELTIKGTVTDSRGYSRTYTKTITVIDYAPPRILPASGWDNVIAARCNSVGALDSNGTNLRLVARRSYSKVVSEGVQKNYCKIQYMIVGEMGNWVDIRLGSETDDNVSHVPQDVTLDTTKTYVVQIRAIDDIGGVGLTTITISTQKVYMHKAGSLNSLGIGKYAETENTVDIAEDLTVQIRGGVEFLSEKWSSLGLSSAVSASEVSVGRLGGSGCAYLVRAGGKHIFVAFNCSVEISGAVTVNEAPIPEGYRPAADIYGLCPMADNKIALIHIDTSGNIIIQSIQNSTEAVDIGWIDGYVDYWI